MAYGEGATHHGVPPRASHEITHAGVEVAGDILMCRGIHAREAQVDSPSQPPTVTSWRTPQERLLGASVVVAAVALTIAGVLHPVDSPAGMVLLIWGPVHTVFFLAIFISPIGVIRIHGSRRRKRAGSGWPASCCSRSVLPDSRG